MMHFLGTTITKIAFLESTNLKRNVPVFVLFSQLQHRTNGSQTLRGGGHQAGMDLDEGYNRK